MRVQIVCRISARVYENTYSKYYVHYINNIHILLLVYLFKQYCKEKTQGWTRLGMRGHGHQSDTEFV